MSHSFNIANKTKALNQKVNREFSVYSKDLRGKLKTITNYEEEFQKMFGNFIDGTLPKDDLYYKIKHEIEGDANPADKKAQIQEKLQTAKKVLPKMHENATEEIHDKIHK